MIPIFEPRAHVGTCIWTIPEPLTTSRWLKNFPHFRGFHIRLNPPHMPPPKKNRGPIWSYAKPWFHLGVFNLVDQNYCHYYIYIYPLWLLYHSISQQITKFFGRYHTYFEHKGYILWKFPFLLQIACFFFNYIPIPFQLYSHRLCPHNIPIWFP